MKARFIGFGELEIDGRSYDYDVVIDRGNICKRRKKPSKMHRNDYGHTPLSMKEEIPWGGKKLIIGTGAYGQLPVMPAVFDAAGKRDIEIIALPTPEACQLISGLKAEKVRAILHVTC